MPSPPAPMGLRLTRFWLLKSVAPRVVPRPAGPWPRLARPCTAVPPSRCRTQAVSWVGPAVKPSASGANGRKPPGIAPAPMSPRPRQQRLPPLARQSTSASAKTPGPQPPIPALLRCPFPAPGPVAVAAPAWAMAAPPPPAAPARGRQQPSTTPVVPWRWPVVRPSVSAANWPTVIRAGALPPPCVSAIPTSPPGSWPRRCAN